MSPAPDLRGTAAAFDRVADRYDQARPEYPPEAVSHVADRLALTSGSRIVEVGAGTGKFTAALVAAGYAPLALEPLGGMAGRLAERLPGVALARSLAERLPVATGWADAVLAAAAFHWFDRDRALAEFRRVLRPGGGLGLLWQVRDEAAWPWDELAPILDRHRAGHPSSRQAAASADELPGFSGVRRAELPHAEARTPAEVRDRILSVSFIAALAPQDRRRVATDVTAIVGDATTVTLRYAVAAVTAQRAA